MDWLLIFYYLGYAIALVLCWDLGGLFRIPMLLNLGFNIGLNLGLYQNWDLRLLFMTHGLLFFLWVVALSRSLTKTTFTVVLLVDLFIAYAEMYPRLAAVGSGTPFWVQVSTDIILVWMASISIVVLATLLRGTVFARIHKRPVDIWINPKKRFMLPIGVWALMVLFSTLYKLSLPEWLRENRMSIAACFLVWGWAVLELPHYLASRRLLRERS